MSLKPYRVIDFSEINKVDEEFVGKKAYEFGTLSRLGIPIADGFIILPFSELSDDLIKEIHNKYKKLSSILGDVSIDIFTSSPNNKSVKFSNVKGDANLILKIKSIKKQLSKEQFAIVVQKNVKTQIKNNTSTNYPVADPGLTNLQANKLINYCALIQKYFYFPYEIDYAVWRGKIVIISINPFTGVVKKYSKSVPYPINNQKALAKGKPLSPGLVTGPIKILQKYNDRNNVRSGEIIILPNLDPSFFKKIKNAKGIIVDSVLLNSLQKTLFRKNFQVPAIEGAENAVKLFQNGNIATMNGTTGEIYSGGLIY